MNWSYECDNMEKCPCREFKTQKFSMFDRDKLQLKDLKLPVNGNI